MDDEFDDARRHLLWGLGNGGCTPPSTRAAAGRTVVHPRADESLRNQPFGCSTARMNTAMTTDQLDRTFSALADPTRRAILARLAEGEATVNDLAEPFPISVQAVSKHLKVLERAGLISRGRDAQLRPSRLEAAPLRDAADWLTRLPRVLRGPARPPRGAPAHHPTRGPPRMTTADDRAPVHDHPRLRRPARPRLGRLDRARAVRRLVRPRALPHAGRVGRDRPAPRRRVPEHDGRPRRHRAPGRTGRSSRSRRRSASPSPRRTSTTR